MEFYSMEVSPGHLARAPASASAGGAARAARMCPERLWRRQPQRPAAAAEAAQPAPPPALAAAWQRRQWRRLLRRPGRAAKAVETAAAVAAAEAEEAVEAEAAAEAAAAAAAASPDRCSWAPTPPSTRTANPPTRTPSSALKHPFNRTARDGGGGGGSVPEADAMSSFGVVIPDDECLREVVQSLVCKICKDLPVSCTGHQGQDTRI